REGFTATKRVPHMIIQQMLAAGELPTLTQCAYCDGETTGTIVVTAECEKMWQKGSGGLTQVLAFFFIGLWAVFLGQDDSGYGNNLVVHGLMRVCEPCQRRLDRRRRWSFRLLVLTVVAGGVILLLGPLIGPPIWAWALLAVCVLVWCVARAIQQLRQRALKRAFMREPIYFELLLFYPEAKVLINYDAQRPSVPPT